MKDNVVLYHDSCNDGFTAAWIARNELRDTADYIPVQYGQEPPDVRGKIVYVLDFSYKRPVMERMIAECKSIVVLDHHKTARDELSGLRVPIDGRIVFDMTKSGARLTWDHFCGYQESPWLVDYTEDRDLWNWNLHASKEINAALSSYPRTFEMWDHLDETMDHEHLLSMIRAGEGILRYQSQLVESACKSATATTLGGYEVLAVNATCLMSEIGEKLAEGRPFGATYFINSEGKKVWSLRSREGGVDVSIVARNLGGGGHPGAAGFMEEIGPSRQQ